MAADPGPDPAFQEMLRRLDAPTGALGYAFFGILCLGIISFIVLSGVQLMHWLGSLFS